MRKYRGCIAASGFWTQFINHIHSAFCGPTLLIIFALFARIAFNRSLTNTRENWVNHDWRISTTTTIYLNPLGSLRLATKLITKRSKRIIKNLARLAC